jgi:hypothetical protein
MSEETDIKDTDLIASLEALVIELKREDVASPTWGFTQDEEAITSAGYYKQSYRITVELFAKEKGKRLAQ